MSFYTNMIARTGQSTAQPQPTEIALSLTNGVPTTTSRDLAEQFGKRHDHVLRDIKEMEISPEVGGSIFLPSTALDAYGREQPAFDITRDGVVMLLTSWKGATARAFTWRYIQAFNKMEAELRAPVQEDTTSRLEKMVEALADMVHSLLVHHVTPPVAEAPVAQEPVAIAQQGRRHRRTREEMNAARDALWGPSRFMSAKAWTRERGHNSAWNKSIGILASKIAKREGITLGVERRKDYKGEAQYVNTYPQGLLERAYTELTG